MSTTTDHLTDLLNLRDQEVEDLKAKLTEYETTEAWRWTRHSKGVEQEGLPVPRLEIRWQKMDDGGYNWHAAYNLVYRHMLGHITVVPLGSTQTSGSGPRVRDGRVETPMRDGMHITHEMMTLRLPGFAIYEGTVTELEPYKKV